jgi:hypothetical protein
VTNILHQVSSAATYGLKGDTDRENQGIHGGATSTLVNHFSEIRKAFLFIASPFLILSYHMPDYLFFSALRGNLEQSFFLLALLVTMTHLKKSNKSLN